MWEDDLSWYPSAGWSPRGYLHANVPDAWQEERLQATSTEKWRVHLAGSLLLPQWNYWGPGEYFCFTWRTNLFTDWLVSNVIILSGSSRHWENPLSFLNRLNWLTSALGTENVKRYDVFPRDSYYRYEASHVVNNYLLIGSFKDTGDHSSGDSGDTIVQKQESDKKSLLLTPSAWVSVRGIGVCQMLFLYDTMSATGLNCTITANFHVSDSL